jgi:hypothetical protein
MLQQILKRRSRGFNLIQANGDKSPTPTKVMHNQNNKALVYRFRIAPEAAPASVGRISAKRVIRRGAGRVADYGLKS